jgi:hypothetical protein
MNHWPYSFQIEISLAGRGYDWLSIIEGRCTIYIFQESGHPWRWLTGRWLIQYCDLFSSHLDYTLYD